MPRPTVTAPHLYSTVPAGRPPASCGRLSPLQTSGAFEASGRFSPTGATPTLCKTSDVRNRCAASILLVAFAAHEGVVLRAQSGFPSLPSGEGIESRRPSSLGDEFGRCGGRL